MVMEAEEFLDLLNAADQSARNGEWNDTLQYLRHAYELDPEHLGTLNGIGTCLIQLGRTREAIPYFERVVEYSPQSPEAQNNLGVAYLLMGDFHAAEKVFQRALTIDPRHPQAWKNLANVYLEQPQTLEKGIRLLFQLLVDNPDDLESLLLLAILFEQGDEPFTAISLYQKVLQIQKDQPVARAALIRLGISLRSPLDPAFNIQKISADEKIFGIVQNILKNRGEIPPASDISALAGKQERIAAIYSMLEPNLTMRLNAIASGLQKEQGMQCALVKSFLPGDFKKYDLMVFTNPHLSGASISAVGKCIEVGKKYRVDLDMDFFALPEGHPLYSRGGPGNPDSLKQLETIIRGADTTSVNSIAMVEALQNKTRRVVVIPPVWDSLNPLWEKAPREHTELRVGWFGEDWELGNLEMIAKPLVRFFLETPEAMLITGGTEKTEAVLPGFPSSRHEHLMMPTDDDLAYLLGELDILLLPWKQHPYFQAQSDVMPLYAGVRGRCWIGSPIASYVGWAGCGVFADSTDEWLEGLKTLATDPLARQQMGENGKRKAMGRKSLIAF